MSCADRTRMRICIVGVRVSYFQVKKRRAGQELNLKHTVLSFENDVMSQV